MADIMNDLKQNLIIKSEVADELHSTFDKLQVSIFYNTKNSTKRYCEKVIKKGRATNFVQKSVNTVTQYLFLGR